MKAGTKARDNKEWWNNGLTTIAFLAGTRTEPFEAYDVAQLTGEPWHPNHWGVLFSAAQAHGLIESAGARASARPTRSGGLCHFWKGSKP